MMSMSWQRRYMGKGLMCTHHLMTSFGQINLLQYRQNHYSSKWMDFFLPESSYNEKTMTMLDVYYQRALKWFTTEQLPHEEIEEITIDKNFFLEPTIGQLASLWLVLLLLVSLLIGILI